MPDCPGVEQRPRIRRSDGKRSCSSVPGRNLAVPPMRPICRSACGAAAPPHPRRPPVACAEPVLDKSARGRDTHRAMPANSESPLDLLWKEYGLVFREFDDLMLARWLAQTLGQIEGKAWRLSHPLLGAYRLAAQLGHERQTWFKRLATPPSAYAESPCCRAPTLPLLTRDVKDAGLICQHCNDTLVPFDEIPSRGPRRPRSLGLGVCAGSCGGALGRSAAQGRGQLRPRIRECGNIGRDAPRARRNAARTQTPGFLPRPGLGRPGRMPGGPSGGRAPLKG